MCVYMLCSGDLREQQCTKQGHVGSLINKAMLRTWGYFFYVSRVTLNPGCHMLVSASLEAASPTETYWVREQWLRTQELAACYCKFEGFFCSYLSCTRQVDLHCSVTVMPLPSLKEQQRKILTTFINFCWVSPTTPGQMLSDQRCFFQWSGEFCCGLLWLVWGFLTTLCNLVCFWAQEHILCHRSCTVGSLKKGHLFRGVWISAMTPHTWLPCLAAVLPS